MISTVKPQLSDRGDSKHGLEIWPPQILGKRGLLIAVKLYIKE